MLTFHDILFVIYVYKFCYLGISIFSIRMLDFNNLVQLESVHKSALHQYVKDLPYMKLCFKIFIINIFDFNKDFNKDVQIFCC